MTMNIQAIRLKSITFVFALTFLLPHSVRSEILNAPTTSHLESHLDRVSSKFSGNQILIATDLDNTLIELNRDLGSEHWILWQKSLLESGSSDQLAAKDFDSLLKLQDLLFGIIPTNLVDQRLKGIYQKLQKNGSSVIGLTSRSPNSRDSSIKELRRNGLNFTVNARPLKLVGQSPSREGLGRIFDVSSPEQSGLTSEVLVELGIKTSKPVAYTGGILLTEGQNKGVMLASYIHHTNALQSVKAVVFIDDRLTHVKAVNQVLTTLYPELMVLAIHYQQSRAKVEIFERSDKKQAIDDYCKVANMLDRLWC